MFEFPLYSLTHKRLFSVGLSSELDFNTIFLICHGFTFLLQNQQFYFYHHLKVTFTPMQDWWNFIGFTCLGEPATREICGGNSNKLTQTWQKQLNLKVTNDRWVSPWKRNSCGWSDLKQGVTVTEGKQKTWDLNITWT